VCPRRSAQRPRRHPSDHRRRHLRCRPMNLDTNHIESRKSQTGWPRGWANAA
jgi:hypothetical protein